MINIEMELKKVRAAVEEAEQALASFVGRPLQDAMKEREALVAARARCALLCDLQDLGLGRFPKPPGEDDPLAEYSEGGKRPDFERSMVITVTEHLEQGDHDWEVVVRLPDGRMLAGSLSDDMPQTPGAAVISAGHMLDAELATERWNKLWVSEGVQSDEPDPDRSWDDMTR